MASYSWSAHRRPSLFPWFALAVFGALLLGGLTALPAAAHSTLLSATPEDGTELDEVPDAVVLTFNENITDLGTDIVISGPDGEDAAGGETEIDGAEVSRSLAEDLAAGEYSVSWRAVSADGHPIDGELTFTLTEGAVAGADGAGTDGAEEPSGDAAESEEATSSAADDAAASESADASADAEETGSDGSEGDQAEADASDAADAQAGAGASDDGGTSGGQVAVFVVIALAVIGGVTALIVRMRRQQ